jgi:hypothetical protein
MEFTEKEVGYLELYKGIEDAMQVVRPDLSEVKRFYYSTSYNYKNINALLSFIFSKDPKLLDKMEILPRLNLSLDMVFALSEMACKYALENPVMMNHLYRMENENNLNNYMEGGMTTSFKSASKSKSEVLEFNTPGNVGVSIDVIGFVPYLDVDAIVRGSVFSDEKEILFPPCVSGMFTGLKENANGVNFQNVNLRDDFEDKLDYDYSSEFEIASKKFAGEVMECRKTGEVSEELSTYCTAIGSYIYARLRNMYNKYHEMYVEQYFSR